MTFPIPKILKSSLKTIAPFFIIFLIVIAFLFGAFIQSDKIGKVTVALMAGFGLFAFTTINSIFESLIVDEKIAIKKDIEAKFQETIEEQEKVFFNAMQSIKESTVVLTEYNTGHDLLVKAIVKMLDLQEKDYLSVLATVSTLKVLKKNYTTLEEMNQDANFLTLRKDIFVFLRTWLIYSILFKREMSVEDIPIRYTTFNKKPYYRIYIKSFQLIKNDYLHQHKKIISELDNAEQQILLESFKEYLEKLISIFKAKL